MALFGLVSKKEYNKLQAEMEALKASMLPYEYWQLQTAEAERYTIPDPYGFTRPENLYKSLSALFIGIDMVSSAGALTPFEVARQISGKEPKDIPNHEFEQLLRNPNPLDSRYEFLYATIAFYKLTGNAYWWLNRADELSKPEELWVIPSHMIKPIPDERMFLRGYLYYPGNGKEIFLQPHEIVQFKAFNPFSRFIGLNASIESLSSIAMAYLGMVGWQSKFYNKSNARLPGILSFEQMIADPQWQIIQEDTQKAAANKELMLLRGAGQGGVKYIPVAGSQKDMEFFTGLDSIDKKILDTVAPGAYTMLSENATEANSRTGRATLNELAIYPMHVMMGEKITNSILPSYGTANARPLIGHFEDIRVTDRQLELQEQQEFAKVHTLAEIREEFYGDDPLGDERDDLLLEQINTQSGGIQKPEPPKNPLPVGNQGQNNTPQQMLNIAANNPPQQDQQVSQDAAQKLEALGKYERYALRNIGKPLKFQNDLLSDGIIREIAAKFATCDSEQTVRDLFKTYKVKYKTVLPAKDAAFVLEGIRLALEKL